MNFDNTWQSLLKPGSSSAYFQLPAPPPFEPATSAYSVANAWWLAELARLIYRDDAEPSRQELLAPVGLRERCFFDHGGCQGAVIESLADNPARFAVLVFRGTQDLRHWLTNLRVMPMPWPRGGWVHAGFSQALEAMWTEIDACLQKVDLPWFYTGHSLGAALATLAATRRAPRALYTFGSPRVGDTAFAQLLRRVPVYRIVNHCDVVPTLPPPGPLAEFCHVGELHYIAHDNRMILDPPEPLMLADWLKNDADLNDTTDYRRWFDPVECLADHAPVNYSAHLASFFMLSPAATCNP